MEAMPPREGGPTAEEEISPALAERVLEHLIEDRGLDLRDRRRDSVLRGVASRLRSTAAPDADAYRALLASEPEELERLLNAMVVPCTAFFRDPEVWGLLASTVVPQLLGRARRPGRLRAWSIGCATGEEAWSAAMLLAVLAEDELGPSFDLVASDREAAALRTASQGVYDCQSARGIPEGMRRRFVVPSGERLGIVDSLRRRVCFAYHDLFGRALAPAAAVLASFEIVFLRNVLIYFERRLQEKAIDRVMATLDPGAVLVLGTAETLCRRHATRFVHYPGTPPHARIFQFLGA